MARTPLKVADAGAALAESLLSGEIKSFPPPDETPLPVLTHVVKDVSLPAPPEDAPFVDGQEVPDKDGRRAIAPDIKRIVERIYTIDAFKDFDDLEKGLSIGSERTNHGVLFEQLDKAEMRARRAHALYLGAKVEHESWERSQLKVVSRMRAEATSVLQAEKKAGERNKAITNDDVESQMAIDFPDEWDAYASNKAKLEGTVKHLERLADLWKQRCHTLATMISNLRK